MRMGRGDSIVEGCHIKPTHEVRRDDAISRKKKEYEDDEND